MERIKVIAREIARLIPSLLRGNRAGFIAESQLSAAQMITLIRIYEKTTIRIGNLSKEMYVSPPTITGVVDRLVRNGYIRRMHDNKDRRVVNVELTNKGKNLVEHILSEINKMWYRRLIHLSVEERESFLRILRRIVEVLTKENV